MRINVMMQVVFISAASSLYADTARFSALVIDDSTSMPISGVVVRANFAEDIGWRAWTESSRPDVDIRETGHDGRCRLSGKTNCGDVCCWVPEPPQGYYAGRGWGHGYKEKNLFGVWQPDNLVATIRLQRVEHPIPLFVKKISSRNHPYGGRVFDKGNGVLEFDFLVGDWLPPVGKGKIADVRFERMPQEDLGEGMNGAGVRGRVYRDAMNVSFLGEENGLVKVAESFSAALRIRTAPEGGYCDSYNCWEGVGRDLQPISSYDKLRDFCFRIRTRKNDNGEIVEAFYGKIYGDISFAPAFDPLENIASVCMLYYLNPTPLDRNLEWDMKTNLCPNPGSLGQLQP